MFDLFSDFNYSYVSGLNDELKSIYIYNYFIKNDKSILVVCNSLYEANMTFQSLSNYVDNVLFFPMDDFLTSEALAISPELKVTRIETINKILNNDRSIVVTNLMGYLRFLPCIDMFKNSIINLSCGNDFFVSDLVSRLISNGYTRESVVNKTGEIAVRGYVLDIFPINSSNPIRIEFWGDTIDSIKYFNVDTQLSISSLDSVSIIPNSEFLVSNDVPFEDRLQKNLNKYGDVLNIGGYLKDCCVFFNNYDHIKTGYNLLVEEMFNYSVSLGLPGDTKYMFDINDIKDNNSISFMSFDNNMSYLNSISYSSNDVDNFGNGYDKVNERLDDYVSSGKIVVVCLSDRYKANKLLESLNRDDLVFTDINNIVDDKINLVIKRISRGFIFDKFVVVSEAELFNKKSTFYNYNSNFKLGSKIRDINKLEIGDYIVHVCHGIGKYAGISTLQKNGLKKDYILLLYRDNDKLYIPVEKIDLILRYSSSNGCEPTLSKLGGKDWEKIKKRVSKRIEDMAYELLELYAKREAAQGFSFLPDNDLQYSFEKEFPYQITPDQLKATLEIKKEMENSHPMDRLLCGDVGYGKTEVAFRAIFKAIMSNKQCALLCPTTILSNQHFNNALDRFSNYPIRVEVMNRFVTPKKQKLILDDLLEGNIDLLIGTHRILSDDVKFKDLGLLVVDEEQRFGVKHKEKIKNYKNNIDVLTLSATPIPRTLQMSMVGIRSLSLIETPPSNRYPVQTYVLASNKQVLKDAIYKEFSRGGQVFILYNHVDDLPSKAIEISKLVPEARIVYAHGQMNKTELEDVMFKFINHEFDILLCTTIIETGIDIPNVNTLIIEDADRFGLAQLYQIRGRVGRSNKIAYCYLMYDKGKVLSEIAVKRLNAIKEFTELGSGFAIAMRDLSIRGAGDILGSEQSGFIDSVGVDLFLSMLDNQVKLLKGEKVKDLSEDIEEKPLVEVSTSIDDEYVSDEEIKILIHKKINQIDSYEKLESVKFELEDRFGKITDDMYIYMHQEWLEKLAKSLGINDVKQNRDIIEIYLSYDLTNSINVQQLFIECTNFGRMFRFSIKNKRLLISLNTKGLDKHFIFYMIDLFKLIEENIKKEAE